MKYIENKDTNKEAHSKIVNDLLNKAKYYGNLDRLPVSVAASANELRELIKILSIYIEEQERKNDYLLNRIEELEDCTNTKCSKEDEDEDTDENAEPIRDIRRR